MNKFTDIKVVGFDLDQTLFEKSPEIDAAIQSHIYQKIAVYKKCSLEEGKKLFLSLYPQMSGREALVKLGIPDAEGVVQEALENADIARFLKPDKKVIKLLVSLKKKYKLGLVTGSPRATAIKKLEKLRIPIYIFDCVITGEFSKREGVAYKEWFSFCKKRDQTLQSNNFVYIGDRKMTDVDVPLSLGMQAILVNVKEEDHSITVPQYKSLLDIQEILL